MVLDKDPLSILYSSILELAFDSGIFEVQFLAKISAIESIQIDISRIISLLSLLSLHSTDTRHSVASLELFIKLDRLKVPNDAIQKVASIIEPLLISILPQKADLKDFLKSCSKNITQLTLIDIHMAGCINSFKTLNDIKQCLDNWSRSKYLSKKSYRIFIALLSHRTSSNTLWSSLNYGCSLGMKLEPAHINSVLEKVITESNSPLFCKIINLHLYQLFDYSCFKTLLLLFEKNDSETRLLISILNQDELQFILTQFSNYLGLTCQQKVMIYTLISNTHYAIRPPLQEKLVWLAESIHPKNKQTTFYSLRMRDLVKWKRDNEAIELFRSISKENKSKINPKSHHSFQNNKYIFSILINAFMNLRDNDSVQSLLDSMKYYNIRPDATTYSQLLNVYHKHDDTRAFEKLASYCLTKVEMDNVLLTVILKKHVQDYERFMSIWNKHSHTPDIELYELRIRAALFKGFETALEVLKEAVDNGTKYRVETYSLFVIYFCKRMEIENAQKAFDAACAIGKPTSKMTTLILQGYCKLDKRKQCIAMCEEFIRYQIYPRQTDVYTVLDALTRLEASSPAKRFCRYLDDIKFDMCRETRRLYRNLKDLEL